MALPVVDRLCKYAGLVTIYFRTYTTTYPGVSGWEFNDSCFSPMEFHSWNNFDDETALGIAGTLIDLSNGYTTFKFGKESGSMDFLPTSATWKNNRLYGWAFGTTLALSAYTFDYPLQIGTNVALDDFQFSNAFHLPNHSNTGAPRPFNGANFPTEKGIYTSSVTDLVSAYWQFAPSATISQNNAGLDLEFSQFFDADHGMSFNGTNWVETHDSTTFANNVRLLETDFVSYGIKYAVTYQNPPSGADINSSMQNSFAGTITPYGFLRIFRDTITVEGKTLVGYGVLCSPDLASYQIIQLIPIDATAANWLGGVGGYSAKIDTQGALWMKNANSATTLFVSAGSVVKSLPIFPPIPLPNQIDSDPILALERSKGVKTNAK